MSKPAGGVKVVFNNKRANFDYELLERFEAGLVLRGTEIKSIRSHKASLQQSFVQARNGELWLVDANIAPYDYGNTQNHDPVRPRKLLLHKREISTILEGLSQKGLTVVPTRLYLRDGRAKIEIALARGKRKHDKRADIAKRDADRQVERALREKYR